MLHSASNGQSAVNRLGSEFELELNLGLRPSFSTQVCNQVSNSDLRFESRFRIVDLVDFGDVCRDDGFCLRHVQDTSEFQVVAQDWTCFLDRIFTRAARLVRNLTSYLSSEAEFKFPRRA